MNCLQCWSQMGFAGDVRWQGSGFVRRLARVSGLGSRRTHPGEPSFKPYALMRITYFNDEFIDLGWRWWSVWRLFFTKLTAKSEFCHKGPFLFRKNIPGDRLLQSKRIFSAQTRLFWHEKKDSWVRRCHKHITTNLCEVYDGTNVSWWFTICVILNLWTRSRSWKFFNCILFLEYFLYLLKMLQIKLESSLFLLKMVCCRSAISVILLNAV
jgi:hypothetical protein